VPSHLITSAPHLPESDSEPLRLEPVPGMHLVELYASDAVAADALTDGVPTAFTPSPEHGGVRFRLVTLPPDPVGHMHRTPTVDLVTVVRGTVALALADGTETALAAGDTVVLRGTEHAWRNHSQEPAQLAVVLLGAGDTPS
jgi:quercetin dioxygenase-like cupin family protein